MNKRDVSIFTQCYDKDYRFVLQENRLQNLKTLSNDTYNVIINYCDNFTEIKKHCEDLQNKNLIKNFYCVNEHLTDILAAFKLKQEDFIKSLHFNICLYGMSALYFCTTEYLCFFTGDSTPFLFSNFINDCIEHDKNSLNVQTYMLSWTNRYHTIKKESFYEDKNFYYTNNFSDQNFFINTKKFKPLDCLLQDYCNFGFPHKDAFESRFYKYMLKHNIPRCVYKHGYYEHKNY